jgi:predicted nucleic acid-binding Zn ribbon protein
MYCSYCGAWNPDDNEFCANCGRPTKEQKRAGRSGPSLCLLVALLIVLLAIVVASVAAFVLRDRIAAAWRAFVLQPTPVVTQPTSVPTQTPAQPTATLAPTPGPSAMQIIPPSATPAPSATPRPTPAQQAFRLAYRGCVPHGSSLGSVKGQVFDNKGKVIVGAKVRIRINDFDWQSNANPATTNADGWYEWTLETGQKVKFVELIVAGRSVPFSPQDQEVVAQGGCFQRVDFVEQ